MKTYSAKPAEVERKWWLVDAEDVVLGRLAVWLADTVRGKNKPTYTANVDVGDHVVVVNAEKVKLTGRKRADKVYHRHTGYPGGIKSATAGDILDGRFPERVILKAVERMMPKESPLARAQIRKLKVYAGTSHPHEAQQPIPVDMAALNPKNKRSGK